MIRTVALMGTLVTIRVAGRGAGEAPALETNDAVERAFGWFRQVEACCTRFGAQSELVRLTSRIGVPVHASAILFEAVRFALAVAEETGGAFDPTVGHTMETRGFNRDYRTGAIRQTVLERAGGVSYRDVRVNPADQTITLVRPLLLDLGAVAKGLAIDMAARELRPFENFTIDAGGDLYLAGCRSAGEPWSVGLRHPRRDGQLMDVLRVSDMAVCTSGDYERRAAGEPGGHHLLDPRTGASARAVASATVVASTAMSADALATAAFVLGPAGGIDLFERQGVDGLIVTPTLERYATKGLLRYCPSILSHAERASHHRSRRADRHCCGGRGRRAGGAGPG